MLLFCFPGWEVKLKAHKWRLFMAGSIVQNVKVAGVWPLCTVYHLSYRTTKAAEGTSWWHCILQFKDPLRLHTYELPRDFYWPLSRWLVRHLPDWRVIVAEAATELASHRCHGCHDSAVSSSPTLMHISLLLSPSISGLTSQSSCYASSSLQKLNTAFQIPEAARSN